MKSSKQNVKSKPARKKGRITRLETDEKPQIEEQAGKKIADQDKGLPNKERNERRGENIEKYKGTHSQTGLFGEKKPK